jgi:hypothetical protein
MPFEFTDRAQLAAFDKHCIRYGRRVNMLTQDCPALRLLHDQLTATGIVGRELSRRIALALEIKLGFLHTHYELAELAGLENRYLVPAKRRARYRPLVDEGSFGVALRRSRAAFALITRIRSLWDKSFLYIALTYEGDATIRQLQNQRSKRKFFFRHFAAGFGPVTAAALTSASDALDSLERDFRTPELHGFGSIRSWVFDTPADWHTQHSGAIIGHWNVLARFLHQVFADCSTSRTSFDHECSPNEPGA